MGLFKRKRPVLSHREIADLIFESETDDYFKKYVRNIIDGKFDRLGNEQLLFILLKVFDFLLDKEVISGESLGHFFRENNQHFEKLKDKFGNFTKKTISEQIREEIHSEDFIAKVAERTNKKLQRDKAIMINYLKKRGERLPSEITENIEEFKNKKLSFINKYDDID